MVYNHRCLDLLMAAFFISVTTEYIVANVPLPKAETLLRKSKQLTILGSGTFAFTRSDMNKICTKCKRKLPAREFYKDRTKKDGLECRCKECQAAYKREHYQQPEVKEAYSERGREYRKKPEVQKARRAYKRKWSKWPKVKEARNEYQREYRKRPSVRERLAANAAIYNGVAAGKVPHINTQTCADCRKPAEHYHHESYKRRDRLNVTPLCAACHRQRHKND